MPGGTVEEGETRKDVEDVCQKVIMKLGHVIQADQRRNCSQKAADGRSEMRGQWPKREAGETRWH